MSQLEYIQIVNFTSEKGVLYPEITLSYQRYGCELCSAPIVLINHALTGNSEVGGDNGWWSSLVGSGKLVDTNKYTIITFDIPGNGYKTTEILYEYDAFSANDIARLFGLGLEALSIKRLYAAVGSSLGGGIAWHMAVLYPDLIEHLIPIASDWKTTDWILGHNQVQFQILENSRRPLHDARMMAMLFYRTPESFKSRFDRTINENLGIYNVESWLLHHGNKLESRFTLHAYKVMTHLLSSVNIVPLNEKPEEVFDKINASVTMVGIDTDLFFIPGENRKTAQILENLEKNVAYKEITSIHGHDAFLIEFDQLVNLLKDIF